MFKSLMRDVTLSLQARSGVTPVLFVWLAIVGVALFAALAFLCVAAYAWLAPQLGVVFAALVMAGVFILIALIALMCVAVSRRMAMRRAARERAVRTQAQASMLLDPKVLGVAMQAGRAIGWQRVIPIAILGFVAAQWLLRERDKPAPASGKEERES